MFCPGRPGHHSIAHIALARAGFTASSQLPGRLAGRGALRPLELAARHVSGLQTEIWP